MTIVVDYGICNVGSIVSMGRKAGGDFTISRDPAAIARAGKLILPGVGAFDRGMTALRELGLLDALHEAALTRKVPVLGVCLGMQLLARRSEEGALPGLGWVAADTVRFQLEQSHPGLKVPHMGWNRVEPARADPLLRDLPAAPRFYFVHSYHVVCDDAADVLCRTTHGIAFCSVLRHGNIWGTQFHPEKSHRYGLALMRNFIALPSA